MAEATVTTPTGDRGGPPMADRPRRPVGRPRQGIAMTIGHALQVHYDDLVAAPMPDRFMVLLAELEAQEKRRG